MSVLTDGSLPGIVKLVGVYAADAEGTSSALVVWLCADIPKGMPKSGLSGLPSMDGVPI